MELVKERNYLMLIGEFKSVDYQGGAVDLIAFRDKRHGEFVISVKKDEPIEMNIPYQITVSANGMTKHKGGKVFRNNVMKLVSYEQRKINQTKGDN